MSKSSIYFKKKRKRKLLIIFLIVFLCLFLIDIQIRPTMKSVAKKQAEITSVRAINEAIIDELENKNDYYSELYNIKTNSEGKVLSITSDSKKINKLKSNITLDIQKKLPTTNPYKVGIPIGTLTGIELLTGHGPKINMKLSIPSKVNTNFESNFTDAGINQTKYQIYIVVETEVKALIPGYPASTAVKTNVLVSETIIIGDVPNVYAKTSSENTQTISELSQLQ